MKIINFTLAFILTSIVGAQAVTSYPTNPRFIGMTLDSQPILKSCTGILVGRGTSPILCPANGTANQILIGGTTPNWGQLDLSTMVTNTLPPANGGTGWTTFTRSGNTTKVVTESGTISTGNCLKADSSGNAIDAGVACNGLSTLVTINSDPLTVTGTNTVSNLTKTWDGNFINITVNGVVYSNVGSSPAFSVSGSTISWNATNAGISIVGGNKVVATYTTGNAGTVVYGTVNRGLQNEALTVVGTNILSTLTKTFDGVFAQLIINGIAYSNLGASPAFAIFGSTIIWNATNSGYDLNYSDKIYALYTTNTALIPVLGTGVSAALSTNINTAGGFVTYSGAFGTPSNLVLTNATGLPTTALTGVLQSTQFPALTGDCTTTAGTLATICAKTDGTNFGSLATVVAGTGVASAAINPINATGGLLTYGIIGTSGATIPLNNGNNTESGILNLTNTSSSAFSVAGIASLAASTTSFASLNIAQGVAPTTPVDGDVWITSAGLYYRFNGTTHGPL
jgi:hypothetical protein